MPLPTHKWSPWAVALVPLSVLLQTTAAMYTYSNLHLLGVLLWTLFVFLDLSVSETGPNPGDIIFTQPHLGGLTASAYNTTCRLALLTFRLHL
jgi:hypothetical protein